MYQYAILCKGPRRHQVLRCDKHKGTFCAACEGGTLQAAACPYVQTCKNSTVVIKNVPAMVCAQCGAVYYSRDTMAKLETIVNGLNQDIECLAVVDFADTI